LNGVHGAGGSNPLIQTIEKRTLKDVLFTMVWTCPPRDSNFEKSCESEDPLLESGFRKNRERDDRQVFFFGLDLSAVDHHFL